MADETRAADDRAERQTIARLTEHVVPALIERLAKSQLGELEVREDGWRVRLRRPPTAGGTGEGAARGAGRQVARRNDATAAQPAAHVDAPRELDRGSVSSPAVGYFAPLDGVGVGSRLRAGDPIGHVDVLGVRQEVVAPIDGVVRALDVAAGQAVEYGQPIGRVEADV